MLIGARQDCVAGGADIAEKMAILKGRDYDFLELALTREEIAGLGPDSAGAYVAMIERTGLPIRSTSMGHFGGFATLAPGERAEVVRHIRALVAFTKAIGADAILLATREAGDRVAAGVTLALEHVAWHKPYRLAELVRAIDHPAVRIYFDVGNCLYVGENPLEQARICAPLTAQLHLKPGPTTPLGAMPLVSMREIFEAAGFQGRGCLEIVGQEGEWPLAEARGLLKMAGYC